MSERKDYDSRLIEIGKLFIEKRKIISKESRESFIEERGENIFCKESWISLRHLANIEEGKTMPSIEMLIKLSYAFEIDPEELFAVICDILRRR